MEMSGCSGGVNSAFDTDISTTRRGLQQQLELLYKQKISNLETENAKLFQLNSKLSDEFQKIQQHFDAQLSEQTKSNPDSLANVGATLISKQSDMENILKAISDKIDAQSLETKSRFERIENVLSTLELQTLSPAHSIPATGIQIQEKQGKSEATNILGDAFPDNFDNVSNAAIVSKLSSGSSQDEHNETPEVTFSIIRIDSLHNAENTTQNNLTQEMPADSRDPLADISDLFPDTQPLSVAAAKRQPRKRSSQMKKACASKGNLARRRVTSDPKIHECDYCGKRFRIKAQLACHLRVHTRETPYKCIVCGKKFPYASSLLHHNRTHNANRQRFKCDICGRSSTTKSSLQAHKRTHQAVKDINCMFCDKSFSTNGLAFDHIRRRHIFEKSIECPKCDMCFYTPSHLSYHTLRHHK